MKFAKVSAFAFLVLSFLSLNALAAPPSPSDQKDGQIIKELAIINKNEVAAARLALRKTTDPNVKQFAQKMVQDHSANLREFFKLSLKTKIMPVNSDQATALEKEGKEEADNLKKLSGKDFDKAYAAAMVNGHQKVLDLLNSTAIPGATNPDLATLLKATKSTVEQHLQMAKTLQSQV